MNDEIFRALEAPIDWELSAGQGQLALLTARSERAQRWALQHLIDDETQFVDGAIVVERRYIDSIASAVLTVGMSIAYIGGGGIARRLH